MEMLAEEGGSQGSTPVPRVRKQPPAQAQDIAMDDSPDQVSFQYELEHFAALEERRAKEDRREPSAAPSSTLRKPYWILSVLQRTARGGTFVSPSLYVSAAVWRMEGAKLSGLAAQLAAFEQLLPPLSQVAFLPLPRTESEAAVAQQRFRLFAGEMRAVQNALAKPFPFIAEVEVEDSGSEPLALVPGPDSTFSMFKGVTVPRAFSGITVSKLSDMVSTVGKSVRKYAETGFSRLGALPYSSTLDDLAYLSSLVVSMAERCAGLDKWAVFLEAERAQPSSASAQWAELMAALLLEHALVSAFFMGVVCELLLRDLGVLAARYVYRMRKSFSSVADADDDEDEP